MSLISLVLAAVVLYYLLQGGLTIVQILAVMLFLALFMAFGVGFYKKDVLALADKIMKDRAFPKKSWLYMLLWAALLVWGLFALFG